MNKRARKKYYKNKELFFELSPHLNRSLVGLR